MAESLLTITSRLARTLTFCAILTPAFSGMANAAGSPMRVTMLSPGSETSGFWGSAIRFAKAVAEDLDIEFEVVVSATNSRLAQRDGLAILNSENPPDYLLSAYWFPATQDFIPAAEEKNVNVFIIINNLPDFDRMRFGQPRRNYKHWVGHIYIDDFKKGQELTERLANEAARRGLIQKETGRINFCGLVAGNEEIELRNDSEHVRALRLYAEARDSIDLNGVYYAYWNREIAKAAIPEILRRHRHLNAIWSQNHSMALGALEGLENAGKRPGEDIIIGTYNWVPEALHAIKDGKLHVSLGGHFTAAGIALILMHDHYHGIDFVDDPGVSVNLPLFSITQENVKAYIKALDSSQWSKIDFRRFSKKYNPELKKYDFSPDQLFGVQRK